MKRLLLCLTFFVTFAIRAKVISNPCREEKSKILYIENLTKLPLSVSAFKARSNGYKSGLLDIGVKPGETQKLCLYELYWFEVKGFGYGSPSQEPQEVLMHSFPNILSIQAGNYSPKTVEIEANANQTQTIMVTIDENNGIILSVATKEKQ